MHNIEFVHKYDCVKPKKKKNRTRIQLNCSILTLSDANATLFTASHEAFSLYIFFFFAPKIQHRDLCVCVCVKCARGALRCWQQRTHTRTQPLTTEFPGNRADRPIDTGTNKKKTPNRLSGLLKRGQPILVSFFIIIVRSSPADRPEHRSKTSRTMCGIVVACTSPPVACVRAYACCVSVCGALKSFSIV